MEATIASIVAAAAPLVFAAVGETITEKAGVVNLSLDGSIALSAMASFAVAFLTGSVVLGFAVGAILSALVAMLVAFSGIRLRLNQVAVGFVLTLFLAALAQFLGNPFVRQPGPSVRPMSVPLLSEIPFVGRILFAQNISVYASLVLIVVVAWVFRRTRVGLELAAVGERPEAAHARGISVSRYRFGAAAVGGALVGIAGAAFSLDVKLGWSDTQVAGFGWIALAIVIFGGWRPVWVALGCYLFGALQVLALKLQPVFPGVAQILPSLPFPLMIFTLVVVNSDRLQRLGERFPFLGRLLMSDAPAALGTNFEV